MVTSVSLLLFFISVFYREHVFDNKKKVDTDKHGWPRVLGSPFSVKG